MDRRVARTQGNSLQPQGIPSHPQGIALLAPHRVAIAFLAHVACLLTSACEDSEESASFVGEVGGSCEPASLDHVDFSGYSVSEIEITEGAAECGGGACLVYYFQGRSGCPYGQTVEETMLPVDDPTRCHTPSGDVVTAPVSPQLLRRRSDDAVFCSCQCAGSDPDASYCTCPEGTECTSVLAGSFCVPRGALYDPSMPSPERCQRGLANCEE